MKKSLFCAVLALLISVSLSACGQRGPLYLPDEEPPAQEDQATPAAQTIEEDDDDA